MKTVRSVILNALLLVSSCAYADIDFGSGGTIVVSGGIFDLKGASITNGSLRAMDTGVVKGTSMTLVDSSLSLGLGAEASNISTDGTVTLATGGTSGSIALGNDQTLVVDGQLTGNYSITTSGASDHNSFIRGAGTLWSTITVTGDTTLELGLSAPFAGQLSFDAGSNSDVTVVDLMSDLVLSTGSSIVTNEVTYGSAQNKINCNGFRVFLGGQGTGSYVLSNSMYFTNADVNLHGDVTIQSGKSIYVDGRIRGNNNKITLSSSGSSLSNGGSGGSLADVTLYPYGSSSLAGAGDWRLRNVTFDSTTYSMTFDGTLIGGSGFDLFGSWVTFGGGTLSLNKDFALSGVWNVGYTGLSIQGNGHALDMGGGTSGVVLQTSTDMETDAGIFLTNISLTNVAQSSIHVSPPTNFLYLSDVKWFDTASGSLHIHGSPNGDPYATVVLPEFAFGSGNIFACTAGSGISWSNGVALDLLSDVAFSGKWSIQDDSVICGKGNVLYVVAGQFVVSGGRTLYLRDMVLKGVASSTFDNTAATVDLANVTLVLDASIDWSASSLALRASGPVTIVTSTHTLEVSAGSTISAQTLYYDTLSTADAGNVTGFGGTGRTMFVDSPISGDIVVIESGSTGRDEFLCALDDGVNGRTITFTNDATITYDGHGHAFHFPYTSSSLDTQVVFTVTGTTPSTEVTLENIALKGLKPPHLSIDEGTSLFFGNQTLIELQQDWTGADALAQTLTFGSASGATNEAMCINLNGHAIDFASASAQITLQGSTGSSLRIMNGKLLNLSGTKLALPASTTLILEDVDIALSSTYTFANAALTFVGRNIIRGASGAAFDNQSSANATISSRSRLTILDGAVYSHHNEGTTNLYFTDATSELELIGGTLRRPDPASSTATLKLSTGSLIVDHRSYIQPGSQGIDFGVPGTDLNVIIRPGARIVVNTASGATSGVLTLRHASAPA